MSREVDSGERFREAWDVIEHGVADGAYSGAVALVAQHGAICFERAVGWAVREPERIPMAIDTIFDRASLTKVSATLPSVLWLVGHGALSLDQPVGTVIGEFGTADAKGEVTIRRLLSHSSGLPAWLPLYLDQSTPEAYVAAIAQAELAASPGDRVIYSDLGFILLGEVVRRVGGRGLAELASQAVFAPLGLRDLQFRPPTALRRRVAATERGNRTEIEMCGERASRFTGWRHDVIWGEVHDENAHYGMGGVSGHAGLFGTARELARYGQMWLEGGAWEGRQILAPSLVLEATREQSPGRGLGWVLAPREREGNEQHSGLGLGPRAFGHTGFTGTSLWMDPERALVLVLLANRLHPVRSDKILDIRSRFNEKVMASLG